VPEYTILEDGAWVGPNVVFTNARYPKSKNAKGNLLGVRVKKNAKIGANCTVLPGVVIGENALVGAGSVVTRDVRDGVVCSGNPARKSGLISEISAYSEE
jgi:acetyltransferase-like isoleucine patch superfamily enzyme